MGATDNDCEAVDTLAAICEEAIEVFRYDKELRPQDRAHKYLEAHEVSRGYNDTALQVCVVDLINRAHKVGMMEAFDRDLGLESKVSTLKRVSADLLQAAISLRGLSPQQVLTTQREDQQS